MFTLSNKNIELTHENYFAITSRYNYGWDNVFNTEPKYKMDSISIEDIKSTEEITSKEQNDSSCLSNVADEENDFEVEKPQKWQSSNVGDLQLIITKFDHCSNQDNNEVVDELCKEVRSKIQSNEIDQIIDEAIGLDNENESEIKCNFSPLIQVKRKKTCTQRVHLEEALRKNPVWSREFMKKLALDLGLKPRQVYKWHWDKTKKAKTN